MNKHVYCILTVLMLSIVLPFEAVGYNETTEVSAEQTLQVVDINKADINTLALLKGVGEKRAQAIITYRELHGEFNSLDELLNVKGVGERMLQLNKGRIKL